MFNERPQGRPPRLFILAGESSGDMLGGELLASLHTYFDGDIELCGIGGERMAMQGLASVFPMEDIALMGFAEILPHSWRLLCRLKDACEAATNFRPDVIVTIDSPGFNFRVVRWMRHCFGREVPCIHYVAPTVWAYKPQRAKTTAQLFDHLLTLLPFEPRYFQAHGLPATFTGHPAADALQATYLPPRQYRPGEPLKLALFPGSRKAELQRFMQLFKEAVRQLQNDYPEIQVAMPITDMALQHIDIADWPIAPELIIGDHSRRRVLHESHVALTKTGTITLEIAGHGLPMVAAYQVNPISAYLVRRMLTIPYVNLINILSGEEVLPEMLQEQCEPGELTRQIRYLIEHPAEAQRQSDKALQALKQLQPPQGNRSGDIAAEVVHAYLHGYEHQDARRPLPLFA